MASFLFSSSHLLVRHAKLTLIALLLAVPADAGQNILYLGPAADGRQRFSVEGLDAELMPGDRLGDCAVTEEGLNCPQSKEHPFENKPPTDSDDCQRAVSQIKEKYRRRYLEALDGFTENLRRKNYELVDKVEQIESLQRLLNEREGEIARLAKKGKETEVEFETAIDALPKEIAPAVSPVGEQWVRIVGKIVNVRLLPDKNSSVAGQVLRGDLFKTTDHADGWLRIDLDDGQAVWIDATYTSSPHSLSTAALYKEKQFVRPAVERLTIRSGPGIYYAAISTASPGDKFEVLQTTRNWLQISVSEEKNGWVHQALLQ